MSEILRMAWIRKRIGEKSRAVLITLGWASLNTAATLIGIFQGVLIPAKTYGGGGGLVVSSLSSLSLNLQSSTAFRTVQSQLDIGPVFGIEFGKLLFFLEILGIAVFASFLISDFERSLLIFVFSYGLSGFMVFFILILPGLTGALLFPDVLIQAAVLITFAAFFPVPLFLGIVGTVLGVVLSERFVY